MLVLGIYNHRLRYPEKGDITTTRYSCKAPNFDPRFFCLSVPAVRTGGKGRGSKGYGKGRQERYSKFPAEPSSSQPEPSKGFLMSP